MTSQTVRGPLLAAAKVTGSSMVPVPNSLGLGSRTFHFLRRVCIPPAVKPRPQSWAIWVLGGSLSGKPKKVILTSLSTEHAWMSEGVRVAIERRFEVRKVVSFILCGKF